MKRAFIVFLVTQALLFAPATAQQGESYMVVEAHSGKVLMASESVVKRPIASLTKIATGVIAVDWAIVERCVGSSYLAREEIGTRRWPEARLHV